MIVFLLKLISLIVIMIVLHAAVVMFAWDQALTGTILNQTIADWLVPTCSCFRMVPNRSKIGLAKCTCSLLPAVSDFLM